MKLSYYNNEVDKILYSMIENDSFTETELPNIIDSVADTIYQYNKDITKAKLKLVVQFLIEHKYQKYYLYDLNSSFNKVNEENTLSPKRLEAHAKQIDTKKPDTNPNDSDTMSLNDSDLESVSEKVSANKYVNPELQPGEKVEFSSAMDLVSHRYDYEHATYKENIYIRRRKRIVEIKKIPQHEQKSIEWLNQRNECLTATAIAIALDEDPYKYPIELFLDKCGRGEPFIENENVHHGKKYEQIGNMFYSFRNNIIVAEYGLIQHIKYNFIGASPDGICEKSTMDSKISKLVGRLLEIKFPKTRKIQIEGDLDGDICPHYYYSQCQTQLYVTGMDECDFLQCKMEEYDSWEDFVKDTNPVIPGLSKNTNLEKGCLIQLLPKSMISTGDPKMCLYNGKYLYPPRLHMNNEEIQKWIADEIIHFDKHDLSKDYMVDKVIYWRLAQVACHLIKADTAWFESKIPMLKQFWDYVLFYRQNTKKLDSLVKFVKETDIKKSAEIFEKMHKEYALANKDTKYKPLYQEETEWRKKYNTKYANYSKFAAYKKNTNTTYDSKKKKIVDV